METILSTIVLFFVLIWAFRVEIGVAKANEALKRIEQVLQQKEATTKGKEKK